MDNGVRKGTLATRLGQLMTGLFLLTYMVFGFSTELRFLDGNPIPEKLFEDFNYYGQAYRLALQGQDPYAMREIGSAYLYPPPSLFVVGLLFAISDAGLRTSFFVALNLLMLALVLVGIGKKNKCTLAQIWWWFPVAFAFAPFLELITIGQINMLTEFGIFLLWFFEDSSIWVGTFGITLAIVTKLTPFAFLLYLMVRRRWRFLALALTCLLLSGVVAGIVFGPAIFASYWATLTWMSSFFMLGTDSNSQALLTILDYFGWINRAEWRSVQFAFDAGLAVVVLTSAFLSYRSRQVEPFFVVLSLGIVVAPLIIWYHHYVFLIMPIFVWMAWSRFHRLVVFWCLLGMTAIQIDRWYWTHGLLPHLFVNLSMLALIVWQIAHDIDVRALLSRPGAALRPA